MKTKTILILGGYGGVGRVIAELLLKFTNARIIIAGRRLEKAQELADSLNGKFKKNRVSAKFADTSGQNSLETAFQKIDLVLVCTTSPEDILLVAKTALKSNIDYLDIQFEQKVFTELKLLEPEITRPGHFFIPQAGFHPGLPAVFVRKGAQYFDQYDKAVIAMAMNSRFEQPESTKDLVNSVRDFKAHVFKGHNWKSAGYKDVIKINFGNKVGVKKCYPLDLVEIKEMVKLYKLKEAGIYVSGFNWFVDNIIFPSIIISHKIKKNSLTKLWMRLTCWGMNTFSPAESYVVFLLKAAGKKHQKEVNLNIKASHSDPYLFTAAPVAACIIQYLNQKIKKKGLQMMGQIVETDYFFNDLKKMGIKIEISAS